MDQITVNTSYISNSVLPQLEKRRDESKAIAGKINDARDSGNFGLIFTNIKDLYTQAVDLMSSANSRVENGILNDMQKIAQYLNVIADYHSDVRDKISQLENEINGIYIETATPITTNNQSASPSVPTDVLLARLNG